MQNKNNVSLTLNDKIDQSCQRFAALPAAGFAFQKPLTYEKFHRQILSVARALKKHGVKKGDHVALLAENSPQWGVAYFGIVRLGAIAVPILPDFPESDVKHILVDAGAKILFTTQRQLDKLYELGSYKLKSIITLDDTTDKNRLLVTEAFSDLVSSGAALTETKRDHSASAPNAEDLASIIYTSGTSGHSKAVMLTHRNFVCNAQSAMALLHRESISDWTFLSILPMSHAYEFTTSFLLPLFEGARIVYAGKTPTPSILEKVCREEKPTVMCMVPMVMEKIYKKRVLAAVNNSTILRNALKFPMLRRVINRKIGKKLYNFFGGHLKFVAIGGAALNPEVEKFLAEADFPYYCGYGLTEASPLVSAGPYLDTTIAIGSSGKPVRDVEARIVNINEETGIGEIEVRGPNIMKGYYRNEKATADTLSPDGWLATGDLGFLDDRNNLYIEGRSKSVIVLSHGENIYPEAIEEKINAYAQIIESLVTENNDKLEARVYLDYELIDAETKGQTQQQKLAHIETLLRQIQREVNVRLPKYSQISQLLERQEPFIKTATHKIKRYLYTNGQDA